MTSLRRAAAGAALLAAAVGMAPAFGQARARPRSAHFTVRVENVSTPATLPLSDGTTAAAPTAPMLWVVSRAAAPLFTPGAVDRRQGLESVAEDGDPSRLAAAVARAPGVTASGVVAVPVGDTAAGPLLPGKAYEFGFDASPGDRLSLAMMFGQSNDLFYAPREGGIALFPNGTPAGDDITSSLVLWDAGTEVNQEPGLGPDQAPRQARPNTGAAERIPVQRVHDRYTYPKMGDVVRVTITPSALALGSR